MTSNVHRPGEPVRPARACAVRTLLLLAATLAALWGAPRGAIAAEPGSAEGTAAVTAELVLRALSLLGVNYRFGGTSPESGLDCSGLVLHVFREAAGMSLPRRSEEMSRVGEAVNAAQLRPGDLVFFNTLRRAFSHVGIYIGDRRFVHSPSRGGSVSIETIDHGYWQRRFTGARRLLALEDAAVGSVAGRPVRHSPLLASPAAANAATALPKAASGAAAATDAPAADAGLYQN
ncbi:MAG: C40 family peptidase [Burkholderiaceae bacterium]|nr:C40 family peptidase [Burkholderiaceae bacterium]